MYLVSSNLFFSRSLVMRKAKSIFNPDPMSYYQIKSIDIPEYVQTEHFIYNEYDDSGVRVNKLVFVNKNFEPHPQPIIISKNQLTKISLEDMSRVQESWRKLEYYFTIKNYSSLPLDLVELKMEELFNITSDVLKPYEIKLKSTELERCGYIFLYGEYGMDDQLRWHCRKSDQPIC